MRAPLQLRSLTRSASCDAAGHNCTRSKTAGRGNLRIVLSVREDARLGHTPKKVTFAKQLNHSTLVNGKCYSVERLIDIENYFLVPL